MENLGKITAVFIIIIGSFLVSLLNAHVILSVSNLFDLKFITQFSFLQIYGILSVVGFIKYTYKKVETKSDFKTSLLESFTALFTNIFVILTGWGVCYIAYHIIS
jgi:hypothetical protein